MIAAEKGKPLSPRIVVIITRVEDGKKLDKIFADMEIPICYQCRGKGTAPSEMLNIFGLSGTTRLITIGFLPKFMVQEMFDIMNQRLSLHQKGGGIAITIPIIGMQSHILQVLKEEVRDVLERYEKERSDEEMEEAQKESGYAVIMASVTKGYSEDVVNATRTVGARGGTVIKGLRRSSDPMSQNLGISTQEEQELVMIVTPREKKTEVMSAINESCGIHTQAHGIVISLPVDEATGLNG